MLAAALDGTAESPITWVFEPESFAPLAKLIGDARYSLVTDHLGTPKAMFDATGAEVWSASIDAYGALRDPKGHRQSCPFRYPGQYEDQETGLYYNRFRYYDPQAGRFLRPDPIRLLGGLRSYGYVADPSGALDPLGLASCRNSWNAFQEDTTGDYASRSEAAAAYRRLVSGQSPWPEGYAPTSRTMLPGERFNMALSPVGPQVDEVAHQYLPGKGQQVQLLVPKGTQMNYLRLVSVRPI